MTVRRQRYGVDARKSRSGGRDVGGDGGGDGGDNGERVKNVEESPSRFICAKSDL